MSRQKALHGPSSAKRAAGEARRPGIGTGVRQSGDVAGSLLIKLERSTNYNMTIRILFLGDIVGKPGRDIVAKSVPALIRRWGLELVVANAENAAGGSGMTRKCYQELRAAGVDVMTMGDHVYKKKEVLFLFDSGESILRPANYPPEAPGRPFAVLTGRSGHKIAVFGLVGRMFMKPADCPFRTALKLIQELAGQVQATLVDMHAEATSEKLIMGRLLDGKVSAVLGTHTHVPTADARILPAGTAYITDVGMTGPYESILGRRIDRVTHTTLTFQPSFFDVATKDVRLCGAKVDIDPATGRAVAIERVEIGEEEANRLAAEHAKDAADPAKRADRSEPREPDPEQEETE